MRTFLLLTVALLAASCASNLGPASLGMGSAPPPIPVPEGDRIGQGSAELTGFSGTTYNLDDQNLGALLRLQTLSGCGHCGFSNSDRPSPIFGYFTSGLVLGGGVYQLRNERYREFRGDYCYFTLSGTLGAGLLIRLGNDWHLDLGGQVRLGLETGDWPRLGGSTEELLDGTVVAETASTGLLLSTGLNDTDVYSTRGTLAYGRLIAPLGSESRLAVGYQHDWVRRAAGPIRLGNVHAGITVGQWEVFGQYFLAHNTPARRELQGGVAVGVRRSFAVDFGRRWLR